MKEFEPTLVVWLDESGMNGNERYEYGYCEKGERCHGSRPGNRGSRVSMVGALRNNKVIASMVYEGHCNALVFEAYVEHCLLPVLSPGQIIVMDNVSFHYSEKAKKLIEAAGCQIKFLPVYSPDLNPIEHHWHALKNKIRKILDTSISLFEAMCQVLKECQAL
jgi:transposase